MKPLMVPLFQELVRGGRMLATQQQDIYTGSTVSLGSIASGGLFVPPKQSGATAIELDSNGKSDSRILIPGIWTLETKNAMQILIAVNLQNSAASIKPISENAVRVWFEPVQSIQFMDEANETTKFLSQTALDPWLTQSIFIFALLCAITESILSRNGSPRTPIQNTGLAA